MSQGQGGGTGQNSAFIPLVYFHADVAGHTVLNTFRAERPESAARCECVIESGPYRFMPICQNSRFISLVYLLFSTEMVEALLMLPSELAVYFRYRE